MLQRKDKTLSKKEIVKWGVPEPFAPGKTAPWKLLSIKPNDTVRGLVLSDQVIGAKTHWMYGRTKPCTGIEHGCEGCANGTAVRWKGYLAVWLPSSRTGWLLEVTQDAFDHNLELSAVSGLRGKDFKCYRIGPHKNSPVRVELLPSLTELANVPPDPDVQEILARIWFGRERRPQNSNEKD